MTRPKLTYFDAPMSRGEECRLALFVSGVDFEDNRLKRADWMALKPNTPFGSLPLLDLPGKPTLAQSIAVLVYIGRTWGLHPKDNFEAARHEAMMSHVEDLRQRVNPSMRMSDEAEKKKAREDIAANYLPAWAQFTENQISDDGPFFGGSSINVVDFKILIIVRWIKSGALDHVPTDSLAKFTKLNRVHDAVEAHPRVREWYAQK
jgi:prostaglandin-H2 D-isomerase / glutathione transferase